MRSFAVDTDAPPTGMWRLMARPDQWATWSPHVRGAWGLGDPEVREGARGAARLFGLAPVPAVITAVVPGRSWTWRVGPVEMTHRVEPGRVAIDLSAPGPLEPALAAAYGPVITWALRRLARSAATSS